MSAWDEKTAQGYAERYGDDPSIFAVLDALKIGAEARVLDIGCGTGSALRALENGQRQLTGVDPTARMIEIACAAGGGAYQVAGAEDLPFEAAAFDVVLAINSIHHWDDLMAGLNEVVRVLSPGGMLVVGGEIMDAEMLPEGQDYSAPLRAAGFTRQRHDQLAKAFIQTALKPEVAHV
ncbi:MAG: class I SAM-dependent methyltransferase [Maritimibacter sp.]